MVAGKNNKAGLFCNRTSPHDNLVHEQTLNHLAKLA